MKHPGLQEKKSGTAKNLLVRQILKMLKTK